MPSGIHAVSKDRSSSDGGPRGPGLAVRIRTRLRRSRLDEQLAQGADPAARKDLALRAEQLRSPAERARIANGLVEALGDARGREPVRIRPRPQRAAVRDAADDILALALRLRDDLPVATAGVAMAGLLVRSKSSPMRRDDAGNLHEAIRAARQALDATRPLEASITPARAA